MAKLVYVAVAVAALAVVACAQWAATAPLSVARTGHTATLLNNGKVLVAGGSSDRGATCLNTAEVYDPATGRWTVTQTMRAARCYHSATLVKDGSGRVFVTGGSTNNGTTYLASTEYYNPTTNTWTTDSRDNMRNARARHAAVLLEGGDVLVTGGYNGRAYLTSAEQYRVDTPLTPWNPVGDLNVARADHTADLLPNGRVLVVGGTTAGEVATASAEFCTNLVYCTWVRTTNDMDFARTGHATTVIEDGDVLITGGFVNGVAAGSTEVFDNTRFSLTVNDMTTARARHAAVTLADGRVLVVGGVTGTSTPLDTVDFYERATRRWSRGELGTLLAEARAGHTATVLPNGRVLVAGGDDRTRSLNSAEVYSP